MTSLLRRIEALAAEAGASRVLSVKVRLGALSHMSPDHFREHFREASSGGLAERAALDVESSADRSDPDAGGIVLQSIEVEAP